MMEVTDMAEDSLRRVYVESPVFTEEDKDTFKYIDPHNIDQSDDGIAFRYVDPDNISESDDVAFKYADPDVGKLEESALLLVEDGVDDGRQTLRLLEPEQLPHSLNGTDSKMAAFNDRYEDLNMSDEIPDQSTAVSQEGAAYQRLEPEFKRTNHNTSAKCQPNNHIEEDYSDHDSDVDRLVARTLERLTSTNQNNSVMQVTNEAGTQLIDTNNNRWNQYQKPEEVPPWQHEHDALMNNDDVSNTHRQFNKIPTNQISVNSTSVSHKPVYNTEANHSDAPIQSSVIEPFSLPTWSSSTLNYNADEEGYIARQYFPKKSQLLTYSHSGGVNGGEEEDFVRDSLEFDDFNNRHAYRQDRPRNAGWPARTDKQSILSNRLNESDRHVNDMDTSSGFLRHQLPPRPPKTNKEQVSRIVPPERHSRDMADVCKRAEGGDGGRGLDSKKKGARKGSNKRQNKENLKQDLKNGRMVSEGRNVEYCTCDYSERESEAMKHDSRLYQIPQCECVGVVEENEMIFGQTVGYMGHAQSVPELRSKETAASRSSTRHNTQISADSKTRLSSSQSNGFQKRVAANHKEEINQRLPGNNRDVVCDDQDGSLARASRSSAAEAIWAARSESLGRQKDLAEVSRPIGVGQRKGRHTGVERWRGARGISESAPHPRRAEHQLLQQPPWVGPLEKTGPLRESGEMIRGRTGSLSAGLTYTQCDVPEESNNGPAKRHRSPTAPIKRLPTTSSVEPADGMRGGGRSGMAPPREGFVDQVPVAGQNIPPVYAQSDLHQALTLQPGVYQGPPVHAGVYQGMSLQPSMFSQAPVPPTMPGPYNQITPMMQSEMYNQSMFAQPGLYFQAQSHVPGTYQAPSMQPGIYQGTAAHPVMYQIPGTQPGAYPALPTHPGVYQGTPTQYNPAPPTQSYLPAQMQVGGSLQGSFQVLSPYTVLPPVNDNNNTNSRSLQNGNRISRSFSGQQQQQQPQVVNAGGSYLAQFNRTKKKKQEQEEGEPYKEYTVYDYRRLLKEVKNINLGSLGPDLENEQIKEKREMAERQAEYARAVKKRHQEESLRNRQKEERRDRQSDNQSVKSGSQQPRGGVGGGEVERGEVVGKEAAERRRVAMEYAKTVPRPKLPPHEDTPEDNHYLDTAPMFIPSNSTANEMNEKTDHKNHAGLDKRIDEAQEGKDDIDLDELLMLHQRHELERQNVALLLRT